MKKLTKLFIVVMILAITTPSMAQKFGIKAGLNLSTMQYEIGDFNLGKDFKMTPGFHVGPTVEIPFSNIFSLEASVLASTKGFRLNLDETIEGMEADGKIVASILYVDIPVTPKVTIDLGVLKIYGLVGPYVGVGIVGVTRTETTINDETDTEDDEIEWGEDAEEGGGMKRLDYGLTVGVGVEIKSFQIGANYNYGLANLEADTELDWTLKNKVLGISLAYKFGGDN